MISYVISYTYNIHMQHTYNILHYNTTITYLLTAIAMMYDTSTHTDAVQHYSL
jgi:hypothetical protein